MARRTAFANRRKHRLPRQWERHRRRRSIADLRIMIWLGLLIGLSGFQAAQTWPVRRVAVEPAAAVTVPVDPYAEARGSRAMLSAQEATPAPLRYAPPAASGVGTPADPGAVRIIDGDTFDYAGVRIRVADIDAPEVHGRCSYETDLAARATARMRALLAAGPFRLAPNPDGRDEDRYGRKLRIAARGGRSLGAMLVSEGLARPWTGHREPWCV